MSCYFRHLKEIFAEAGITVTSSNKKELDKAIHDAVGTAYKDCPATWKKIKQDFLRDQKKRRALVSKLRSALGA